MAYRAKKSYTASDLVEIMALLRGEGGCPWDREQTHKSIRKNFIEETYEVCEAIDNGDADLLREELGDVLLQVVFHTQMEQEAGHFDFNDVADGICKKLIVRHPHIFGDVKVADSDEVLANWDKIKQTTKKQSYTDTLESVPSALPALMRAEKVQHRAARGGMEYPDAAAAFADLSSELDELREALGSGDGAHAADELGDLLFAAVNVARHLHTDPEEQLSRSTGRFIERFTVVERLARERGLDMAATPLDELNRLWAEAKVSLRAEP